LRHRFGAANHARHAACSLTCKRAERPKLVPIRDSFRLSGEHGSRRFMKHAASRELYTYWEALRGRRPAPQRAEIEPAAIRHVLSEAFIVALDRGADYPFRLAGTRVCALFGRELKGQSFPNLWDEASQKTMRDLLHLLTSEMVGTVAGVTAQNSDGESLDLELLLLPLIAPRPALARSIGVLAPIKVPRWIGLQPIGALTLGTRRHVGVGAEKRLLPQFLIPWSNRSGLVVYEGGRP
jgi:hypothetical protein